MDVHAGKLLSHMDMEKLQRLGKSRTLQAIGGGSGLPLTRNGEGEEIVYAHMKV